MKSLKYIILIMLIIVSWLLASDVSFAEELIKPSECTQELPKDNIENSQILKSLEKVGEIVWNNKYLILGTFLVIGGCLIVINDITTIVSTPLITEEGYAEDLERMHEILKAAPNPHFQSFQEAIYKYPELQRTTNSALLPLIIESKIEFYINKPFTTPDGTWKFLNLISSNDNIIYRIYMDYSLPITTNVNPADLINAGSCVVTNVVLLDPMLIHSAPYTMIEILDVNTANRTAEVIQTIFIKKC